MDEIHGGERLDGPATRLVLDGTKLAWHKERVEAWLSGERVAPVTIDCALTRRCTYNCAYCIGKFQGNGPERMTRDVILRFLDDAAEIGVKAVSFVSDGESTCSPHLYDAILRGKENGLDIALGTNGYLLKNDRLAEILPALTYLRFNFSAGEPVRYSEIMGAGGRAFATVVNTIRACVDIKRKNRLSVTLGLQMVLLPQFADQVLPLVHLGRELGVDYTVIKHCSDDNLGSLGVEYGKYFDLIPLLERAESLSSDDYLVQAKWSKILSHGRRCYDHCYGPPLMMQFSGSGLVAPCGGLFNERFRKYHIGNLVDTSFKAMWRSERYWEVLRTLASDRFDVHSQCVSLCLQHKVNEALWRLKEGGESLPQPAGEPPAHVNFV